MLARTGPERPNSAETLTVAELLDLTAPPRADTTGIHLTSCGKDAYILSIQGPESRWLTARLLEVAEALHERMLEKQQVARD